MSGSDGWERDPGVKKMRLVFRQMEEAQRDFLHTHGISCLDKRLRSWREKALRGFEKAWAEMAGRPLPMDENRAATLYLRQLAEVMALDGVTLRPEGSGDGLGGVK